MTTWVPSEQDLESMVTAFRESTQYDASFLVYSNEAAYHSDIAEVDGNFQAGAATEQELEEQTDYTDGYAIRVTLTYPITNTKQEGRGLCIIDIEFGGSCFYMEVGDTSDVLNEFASYWQTADAVATIKDGTNSSMGTLISSSLPTGWGGTWDTQAIKRGSNDETVQRNRFLPTEADEYTQDYRFQGAMAVIVAIFSDVNGGSWEWEDVTLQGSSALTAGASLAIAYALSF